MSNLTNLTTSPSYRHSFLGTRINMCKASLTLILFLLFAMGHLHAQNLESIGKRKPLKVTGGVNVNTILYGVNGIAARRDPFSYFITGNLNLDIYEWVIPVSFTYSNQSSTFQQPFNQYCFHPKYKWIAADIGYTSQTYSSYTLNGHVFNGAAVELTPKGKFSYNIMYGRFLKAIEYDSMNVNAEDAAFRRMGYGAKISFRDNGDYANLIAFHAQDKMSSIEREFLPEEITPKENMVLSAAIGKRFLKRMFFEAEYASSALSTDISVNEFRPDNTTIYKGLGPLFTTRTSTSYYDAFKSALTYKADKYSLGVAYERIDPEYQTLGSYFFNNDLENITGSATALLFKGKVNLAVNAGVQRDDLENRNISEMKRFVGSLNLSYKASDKLNLTGAYSNFQTFTNIRSQFQEVNQLTPYDNLDTLNFTQISQSSSFNANYILSSKKELRQSVNLNTSVQESEDLQGGIEQNSGSQFIAMNASYNIGITPKNIGFALVFNLNQNKMVMVNSVTMGPTVAVNKSFFDKKLKLSTSTSYNQSKTNGTRTGQFMNFRVASTYTLKKKHHLQASLIIVNRQTTSSTQEKKFTEYTGSISYNYSF